MGQEKRLSQDQRAKNSFYQEGVLKFIFPPRDLCVFVRVVPLCNLVLIIRKCFYTPCESRNVNKMFRNALQFFLPTKPFPLGRGTGPFPLTHERWDLRQQKLKLAVVIYFIIGGAKLGTQSIQFFDHHLL